MRKHLFVNHAAIPYALGPQAWKDRLTRLCILVLLIAITLSGCVSSKRVTDLSDRSVGYAFINLDRAVGNRLVGGSFVNDAIPNGSGNVFPFGVQRLGNGFLVYQFALRPGQNRLRYVRTMNCAGLCTQRVNAYDFGDEPDGAGAATVTGRGVYDLGSYALASKSNPLLRAVGLDGVLGRASFDILPIQGPSRQQVLQLLLDVAPEAQKPLIQAEIAR